MKRKHYRIHQSPLLFTNLLSGETSYQMLNLLGYYQSLTDPGEEENIPFQATLAILYHIRGEKATDKMLVKFIVQRHRFSKV